MNQTFAITRKELNSYFSSPMALIFVGVFLAATLFTFFWVDTFFARNIADVRPMFRWMPLLLIFLVSTLTMRQWSEEQQTGTLEILLTLPAHPLKLVLGKFLGVMSLVIVALALTLFLPISVSFMGNLDWGPVWGGYLAALLLAGAYAAIGLFISSRTDNQIVALILTALLGGLFYLVGTRGVTDFAGDSLAEIFRAIGAGSRFESIERGVIDVRDLVYYLCLTFFFLALNVVSLDSHRWSDGDNTRSYRQGLILTIVLIGLNLVALNVWLFPFSGSRLDLTEQKEYSLSPTTINLLSNLQEPLLIRGYFSEKTHPLLAPLVPQIRDTLEEYRIASNGKVVIEIIDPLQNPELEAEANQTYGIQPTPLQAADRYGSSLVNAYFDVLVRYGDQSEVLGFQDLIEVQQFRDGGVDVRLRNLEYDLTRAIKKSVFGFQSIDALLASIEEPISLTLYLTPNSLPENLASAPTTIKTVAQDLASSSDQFSFESIDVDAPNSPVNRNTLQSQFGLQPIPISFFSDQTYYLHMVLQIGDQAQLLFPSGDLSEATIRTAIESALKRASSDFLKVVGIWIPPDTPSQNAFGQQQPSLKQYNAIAQQLQQEYTVRPLDLTDGQVPSEVDVLLVIAPQSMSDLQRFAVDQYLMRGGSVVVAAGNYAIDVDQFSGSLAVQPIEGGLQEMLASYGLTVQQGLVFDPQNEPFPVPVTRQLSNGFQVQEIQQIPFPPFIDIRADGMDRQSPILASLPAVTLNFASPVTTTTAGQENREVATLLQSSPAAWLRTSTDIQPNPELYPNSFPIDGPQQVYPLAVSMQGVFESFYQGKESPIAQALASENPPVDPNTGAPIPLSNVGTLESSPDTARLVVIGSAEFLNDNLLNLSNNGPNSLQFMQNTVDWSVEDLDLLTIRSRGSASRILDPLSEQAQLGWEYSNYGLALVALLALGWVWRLRQRSEVPMELVPPVGSGD